MTNKQQGIHISLYYIPKRKRKERLASFSGACLDEALHEARNFILDNDGLPTRGNYQPCTRWKDSFGWMESYYIFADCTKLSFEELTYIAGGTK